MSFKIAVAGKGGTGKTTVCSLLLGALMRRGIKPLLAVDADPNSCLAEYLGVEMGHTLGQIRDDTLAKKDEIPAGVSKAQVVEYAMHRALSEQDGFDLLTMGRTEGPGCYCYVNNLLRGFMTELEKNYAFVVIDNEAGLEHLSRRTSRNVDALAVISDGTRAGLTAAGRIVGLVCELDIGVGKSFLVQNRHAGPCLDSVEGASLAGCIPPDPAVEEIGKAGGSLLSLPAESPAAAAADGILEALTGNRWR